MTTPPDTQKILRFRFGLAASVIVGFLLMTSFMACSAGADKASDSASQSADVSSLATDLDDTIKDTSASTQVDPQAAEQLAARDIDFAVDPARTDWNFADNGRKVVYLTIDDGPSPLTGQVLDILDRYNAKATFFVVGTDPNSYHYIKEAYQRGHTIGLHTFSHDYAYVYSSTDAYFADLDQIANVVQDQIGYVPCFMRFPGGTANMISAEYSEGIMSVLVDEVQARGYQYYDWIGSVGDGSVHTTDEIIGYAKETPLEQNIVLLCHDSETKQSTVDALPAIIEYFQGLGYSFEAIDRSTWVCHHAVQN